MGPMADSIWIHSAPVSKVVGDAVVIELVDVVGVGQEVPQPLECRHRPPPGTPS